MPVSTVHRACSMQARAWLKAAAWRPAASGMLAWPRVYLLLGTLGAAHAQCTGLPEVPPGNTEYSDPSLCGAGTVLESGQQCAVQCTVGFSQDAAGTYEYICTGTALTVPTPQCEICPLNTYNSDPGAAECDECPTNSGTTTTGGISAGSCNCFPGYTGNIVLPTDECTPCIIGTYQPNAGAASCLACTATVGDFTTTAQEASTQEADCFCQLGYAGAADSCDICGIGQYSDSLGEPACTECPTGSTTTAEASTELEACLCNAGFEGDAATTGCQECAVGQYSGTVEDGECSTCPASSSTAGTGNTAVTACECDAGHFGTIEAPTNECSECEVGQYNDAVGAAACIECPASSSTEAAASKALDECLCEQGFGGDAATSGCEECAVGEYSDLLANDDCSTCPASSSTAGTGNTAVTACECDAGHFGTIEAPTDECSEWEVGQYNADTGAVACIECPDDSSTVGEGSTDAAACLCVPGTGGDAPTEGCEDCPVGDYKESLANEQCDQCPESASTTGPRSNFITFCLCEPGHFGLIETVASECTACLPGTYAVNRGQPRCDPCPLNSGSTISGSITYTDCLCDPGTAIATAGHFQHSFSPLPPISSSATLLH